MSFFVGVILRSEGEADEGAAAAFGVDVEGGAEVSFAAGAVEDFGVAEEEEGSTDDGEAAADAEEDVGGVGECVAGVFDGAGVVDVGEGEVVGGDELGVELVLFAVGHDASDEARDEEGRACTRHTPAADDEGLGGGAVALVFGDELDGELDALSGVDFDLLGDGEVAALFDGDGVGIDEHAVVLEGGQACELALFGVVAALDVDFSAGDVGGDNKNAGVAAEKTERKARDIVLELALVVAFEDFVGDLAFPEALGVVAFARIPLHIDDITAGNFADGAESEGVGFEVVGDAIETLLGELIAGVKLHQVIEGEVIGVEDDFEFIVLADLRFEAFLERDGEFFLNLAFDDDFGDGDGGTGLGEFALFGGERRGGDGHGPQQDQQPLQGEQLQHRA